MQSSTSCGAESVKTWVMWSHFSAIGGLIFPFGNILGPLIVWLVKRDEIPEVNVNGKEALNFQITMSGVSLLFWGVSVLLAIYRLLLPKDPAAMFAAFANGFETIGWLAIAAVWITFVTQASIAANKGEPYAYRYSLRLIK